ncbi:MAG: polyphosphate polymerase domain-containing protein [Pirellulales bacterium]|nr:polyphosphate polymerase domain-containing protein [Pirellulales bacterium]
MGASALQSSRYELKYWITEAQATTMRAYVRQFLVPDEHSRVENNFRYSVHSLYCDSRRLQTYHATCQGLKNRFKLRLRYYDDQPTSPVFLEIKRRVGGVIFKQRAATSKPAAAQFLCGHPLVKEHLIAGESAPAWAALNEFCDLYHEIRAVPCVYVTYSREAYVSPQSNDVRLTFDRDLYAHAYRPSNGLTVPPRIHPAQNSQVLLELKFTDRYPQWMRHMVAALNLLRVSFAKYVRCLDTVGCPWQGQFSPGVGLAS